MSRILCDMRLVFQSFRFGTALAVFLPGLALLAVTGCDGSDDSGPGLQSSALQETSAAAGGVDGLAAPPPTPGGNAPPAAADDTTTSAPAGGGSAFSNPSADQNDSGDPANDNPEGNPDDPGADPADPDNPDDPGAETGPKLAEDPKTWGLPEMITARKRGDARLVAAITAQAGKGDPAMLVPQWRTLLVTLPPKQGEGAAANPEDPSLIEPTDPAIVDPAFDPDNPEGQDSGRQASPRSAQEKIVSALLAALAQANTPEAAAVLMDTVVGRINTGIPPAKASRFGVAVVVGNLTVFPQQTLQLLTNPNSLGLQPGINAEEIQAWALHDIEPLSQAGLRTQLAKQIGTVPQGFRQRLSEALATPRGDNLGAQVVLLLEPGTSDNTKQQCLKQLSAVGRSGLDQLVALSVDPSAPTFMASNGNNDGSDPNIGSPPIQQPRQTVSGIGRFIFTCPECGHKAEYSRKHINFRSFCQKCRAPVILKPGPAGQLGNDPPPVNEPAWDPAMDDPLLGGPDSRPPASIDLPPDQLRLVVDFLWNEQFGQVLTGHAARVDSIAQIPPIAELCGVLPTTASRNAMRDLLRRNWDQGPGDLQKAGFFGDRLRDPGMLLVLKSLPRQEKTFTRPRGEPRGEGGGEGEESSPAPVNPAIKKKLEERERSHAWQAACAELTAKLMERCRNLARSAETMESPPVRLHDGAKLSSKFELTWPDDLRQPLGSDVQTPPLRIRFARIEETSRFNLLNSFYQTKLRSPQRHQLANGYWYESVSSGSEEGLTRSTDLVIMVTGTEGGGGDSERGEGPKLERIVIEMMEIEIPTIVTRD